MLSRWFRYLSCGLAVLLCLSGCGQVAPRVSAQERLFPSLSLQFLDVYELPDGTFQGTRVGGLSAIAYDSASDRFYALSDDRSEYAPARFYTLQLVLQPTANDGGVAIERVGIESVTTLRNAEGKTFARETLDPEGIAIAPGNSVYIASEGVIKRGVSPFVARFNRETGRQQKAIALPAKFLPDAEEKSPQGIRDNLGFESLSLNATTGANAPPADPYRVFFAAETSLAQDKLVDKESDRERVRLLHYLVGPVGAPVLVAEHLYLLDSPPLGSISYGLSELTAIPPEGFFLSLERSYGLGGFGAKVFQVAVANATDTSRVESLGGELGELVPLRKQLLFDLRNLDLAVENVEGMTLGPRLPDGSQSLVLVSDNNFSPVQKTQLLLFRLATGQKESSGVREFEDNGVGA